MLNSRQSEYVRLARPTGVAPWSQAQASGTRRPPSRLQMFTTRTRGTDDRQFLRTIQTLGPADTVLVPGAPEARVQGEIFRGVGPWR